MVEDFIKRRDGETVSQYKLRLLLAKEDGLIDLPWRDIASMPEFLCNEDYIRRVAKGCVLSREAMDTNSDEVASADQTVNLYDACMERVRARDERTQLSKALRYTARFERRMDIMEDILHEQGKVKYPRILCGDAIFTAFDGGELIVCLSDLHIGASFNSMTGKYNVDIAKKRMAEYATHVKDAVITHHINNIHVVLLGDMISGSIHKSIALTNEQDVVQQTMTACEYIADFIFQISLSVSKVTVHSVCGNHSRIDQKDDALKVERLDKVIPWYVSNILRHLDNVAVVPARDATFDSMDVCGKTYYMVHGDFDPISGDGALKTASLTGVFPYAILYGHKHFPASTEQGGIKLIQSGSLCGSGDDYALQKRLVGRPSQTMLVCNSNGIKCIYNVDFGGDDNG